ncbi:hypothetical protein PFISCL1PPCAC_3658, partial [Pristionchus fissidentatus]
QQLQQQQHGQKMLMQPVHLQPLPQSAAGAAPGMLRRPMPIAGTPASGGRMMRPSSMTPQMMQQQQRPVQPLLQLTPGGPAAAAAAARQQQQGSPAQQQQRPAAVGTARAHAGATPAARSSTASGQQQPHKYTRQQLQLILRTTNNALEKVRQLRTAVRGSYIGAPPYWTADVLPESPMLAAPHLSDAQERVRIEKIQAAKAILDSLVESLRYLPHTTAPLLMGKERELAYILDEEQMREGKAETVGEEIQRSFAAEELRTCYYNAAQELLQRLPYGRSVAGPPMKEGLNAHSSFMLCLTKLQQNKRLLQQRNMKIRVLNSGPRDARFELSFSTPITQNPSTTLMRCVISVCDGCLARASFLGPTELVDSLSEERSDHIVYRQMSVNATQSLLSTAKGRHMSLMSSVMSIINFLQNFPSCLSMNCSECGKCLRDWLPPTRFVNLNPLKYAHQDCFAGGDR